MFKTVLGGALAAAVALGAMSPADADDKRFRLKMHSAFGSNVDILVTSNNGSRG